MIKKDGDKYYYVFEGSKTEIDESTVRRFVEFSEGALNSHQSNAKFVGEYLSASEKYLENKSYKIGELPLDFDNVVRIDLFINRIEQEIRNKYPNLSDTGIKEEIARKIEPSILITREQIANPLLKNEKAVNEYLLSRLERLKFSFESIEAVTPLRTDKNLSMSQVGLLHYYQGIVIDEQNKKEIASKFGFNNKTSGHKIYQWFLLWSKTANRIGRPDNGTLKSWQNKLDLFESVIELLPHDKRVDATKDIAALRKLYKSDYP